MKIIFNERIQDNEKSRILSKYGLTKYAFSANNP